jgi:hypothetical protein
MNRLATTLRLGLALSLLPAISLLSSAAEPVAAPKVEKLFDGKTLDGWKVTKFGGEGEVSVEDGLLRLYIGNDMTGVTYAKPFPKMDYEISLEAMRTDGGDFFCGLTFPVGEHPLSFIVGGWGGGTVGLSSIDDADASENETTTFHSFDDKKWYPIKIRVTKEKVEAWIGKEQVVNFKHVGHRLTIRSEVELSKPLGIATWSTAAALRNIELRRLTPAE